MKSMLLRRQTASAWLVWIEFAWLAPTAGNYKRVLRFLLSA